MNAEVPGDPASIGDDDFPVLISGGGLVGLTLAMLLAEHGIPSLAIERRPRACRWSPRPARRPPTSSPPPAT